MQIKKSVFPSVVEGFIGSTTPCSLKMCTNLGMTFSKTYLHGHSDCSQVRKVCHLIGWTETRTPTNHSLWLLSCDGFSLYIWLRKMYECVCVCVHGKWEINLSCHFSSDEMMAGCSVNPMDLLSPPSLHSCTWFSAKGFIAMAEVSNVKETDWSFMFSIFLESLGIQERKISSNVIHLNPQVTSSLHRIMA